MTGAGHETFEWAAQELGAPVVAAAPLLGGMSSQVWRCELADGRTIVVRNISDQDWLERDPDLIRREARALESLAGSPVPAPHLLAADPDAGRLAMTLVPGSMCTSAPALTARLDGLAGLAASIACVELPAGHGLPEWSPWAPVDPNIPTWGDAGLWAECIAVFAAGRTMPRTGDTLLHRDLHPLNVLWQGVEVSGLVDWVNACVGHPHAELAHCRWNLAVLVGQAAAELFLDRYLALTAGDRSDVYDPWWDLATAIGLLPGPIGMSGWYSVGRTDLHTTAVVAATESFVRAALDA